MVKEPNLLIPGPTPLPPEVLAALSRPMVDHRSEAFGRMLAEVLSGLRQIFQTTSPVLPFAASGTAGLEAAIVNVLSPGDRVLALTCGVFGDRFAAVATAYGAEVIKVEADWGRGIDPARVEDALRRYPDARAVLLTHNETSTGVANNVRSIAELVRPHGALLLVDAVSSLAAIDLQTDAWSLDIVITGSQKALMGPPGGMFICVGPRAWEAAQSARMPRHYFSFARANEAIAGGTAYTPFTPAIPVIHGLHVSIPMILRQGLPARFAHHRRLAQATRQGITALGLSLFAEPSHASDTVTAVRVPDGLDGEELRRRLQTKHNVFIAGGQGRLEGKIVRIGHMGNVSDRQILAALAALEDVLAEMGRAGTRGAAAQAAVEGLTDA